MILQDNCVKNLLNEKQKCSKSMSNLIDNFQKYCTDTKNKMTSNEIMDLKPTSEFVLRYIEEADYIQQGCDNTSTVLALVH